jgi:hypothetical protein
VAGDRPRPGAAERQRSAFAAWMAAIRCRPLHTTENRVTINSISAALMQSLETRLGNTPVGEKTVTASDGSSVTTVKSPAGVDRIVSETGAGPNGGTLTEVGYVSPVLLQRFVDSLFGALQADGLDGDANAGQSTTAAAPTANPGASSTDTDDTLDSSLQALMQQLDPNAAPSAATSTLLKNFESLMQGSGIVTPDQTSRAALQAFLTNAMPAAVGTSGAASKVDVTA